MPTPLRICIVIAIASLIGCGGGGSAEDSTSITPTPQPGLFSATGSMSAPRTAHTAALLSNGKVLVAGGTGASGAEVYDPSAGTFAPTGAMSFPDREGVSAVALANGKVLVCGGLTSTMSVLTSTELYDPSSSTFTATGSMLTGSYGHRTVLLSSGLVLLIGADGEVYSPTTGTWTGTLNFGPSRSYAAAVRLADGKVLVCGGQLSGGSATSSALIFDPSTNQFSSTGSMSVVRENHTATLLANGKVLITGGRTDNYGTTIHATCELYDPSTGTFTATGSLKSRRAGHTATLLASGKVLLAGGYSGSGSGGYLASGDIYDPATGITASTNSMIRSRESHTATLLNNGKVLLVGGADYNSSTATAEIYW